MLADYQQDYDPLGHSLGVSSIVAALPLLVLFVLLGVLRMRAWLASLIGLAVALLVAVVSYSMPIGDALNSGLLGAAFGFFPIMWIVINAIWVYNLTVETGHFDVLRRSFASISDDQRVQAIIIAFCFGALMEALAGFGTPVAISSVMLIALGFRPLKAATLALVANTAPVAFGALAVPITTLATVTKLPVDDLGSMVGGKHRSSPCSSRSRWCSSSMANAACVRCGRRRCCVAWCSACSSTWHPTSGRSRSPTSSPRSRRRWPSSRSPASGTRRSRTSNPTRTRRGRRVSPSGPGGGIAAARAHGRRRGGRCESGPMPRPRSTTGRCEVFRAYAPYLIIIVVFVIATRVSAITGVAPKEPGKSGTGLESVTRIYDWPGLHILNGKGDAVATTFKLNLLSAAGTLLLLSGLLTMLVLGVGPAGRCARTVAPSTS